MAKNDSRIEPKDGPPLAGIAGRRLACRGSMWPHDAEALDIEQRRLAALSPTPWTPPEGVVRVAACYLAFLRGQGGPGHPGDPGWASAVLMEMPNATVVERVVRRVVAGASYDSGRLALRAGPALEEVVSGLALAPHVVLVDATGRDHPRGAGLALHLGAALDLPTVGVTHRPLIARGPFPDDVCAASSPLVVGTTVVGAWLRTRTHARPLAVHAAWRTDPIAAVRIVLRGALGVRTPEPLRAARELARTSRDREQSATGDSTTASG